MSMEAYRKKITEKNSRSSYTVLKCEPDIWQIHAGVNTATRTCMVFPLLVKYFKNIKVRDYRYYSVMSGEPVMVSEPKNGALSCKTFLT